MPHFLYRKTTRKHNIISFFKRLLVVDTQKTMQSSIFTSLDRSPQHLNTLANWFHDEWGYLHPNSTRATRRQELTHYLAANRLPVCYLLEEKNEVLGTASIVQCDMDTRPDLSPWLASVYVPENLRKKGLGEKIVTQTVSKAKKLGFGELFLFTPSKADWYEKMGWQTMEIVTYREYPATLMRCRL